jgi:two-component system NarL family response regulator
VEQIKILIVDDHTIFRQGLTKLLESYEQIQVIGEASTGMQAIEKAGRLSPHIILMDIKMPRIDGIETIELIKKDHPEIRIVALSMYEDPNYVLSAIKAGASGYVQKSISADKLLETILETYSGQRSLVHLAVDSEILMEVIRLGSSPKEKGLTEQERRVIQLMAEGNSNKQIAEKLFVSEQTVKGYVHSILQKLGATCRAQAVAISLREGLLEWPSRVKSPPDGG